MAVDAGQARDGEHVASRGLVEQLLGAHRRARGEGLAGRRAAGQQVVEEALGAVPGVGAVGVFHLLREDPVLQPRQELLAEGAEHARLREVDVAVDEARHDDAVLDVLHREPAVPPGDLIVGAEVGDPAVLDDQQAVGMEARRVLFLADVLPGIVDEVEEGAADADGAHDRAVSCW